jgi:hypothetical protein
MNIKQMLKLPLLDPSVPDDKLADWIESHTMAVHQFLGMLPKVRQPHIPPK